MLSSDCWGGCVSNNILTQEWGILTLLEPVFADCGFTIAEDVILHGANLEVLLLHRERSSYPKKLKGPNSYLIFAFMFKDALDFFNEQEYYTKRNFTTMSRNDC